MKLSNIKSIACLAFMGLALSSCDDYLDRPTEDGYDTSNYYSTDAQCRAGVNYLYNSPWYDFMRGFFKVTTSRTPAVLLRLLRMRQWASA